MRRTTRLLTALAALSLTVIAGGNAAVADAGAAGCRVPGVLFCENFDTLPTGGPSTLRWGVDTRNGSLTIERAARQPGNVLHVRTLDNGRAFLRADDLTVPAAGFYGRMRVRVKAFPTAPDWAHYTLVEATGTGSSEVVRPLGGQWVPPLEKALWGIGADGGPTGDWTAWTEEAPSVAERWQCVEWRFDTATDTVTTWFRGGPTLTASRDAHGGNDVPFELPTVDTVKIGWQLYQGGTTPGRFDVWIDDIALATQRIGC